MKTQETKLTRKGVTLIELTVVIAVILTLIGVLFIGAQTYKNHADKAACIVNQSSINKAVRAFNNLGLTPTTASAAGSTAATNWDHTDLSTADLIPVSANLVCPADGAEYDYATAEPLNAAAGTRFSECANFDGPENTTVNGLPSHRPAAAKISSW